MSLQARLLIPSGFSANDPGVLIINISQGHKTVFDLFFFSLLEKKGCGFLNIKNMVFHSLDLEENSSQCTCSWINNSKAAYVLKMWLWETGFWPCWCIIQTFISVTVPEGFTWQSVLRACYCWDLDMTDEIDKSQAIQPRGKGNIKFSLSGTIQ